MPTYTIPNKRRIKKFLPLFLLVGMLLLGFAFRAPLRDFVRELMKPELPIAKTADEFKKTPQNVEQVSEKSQLADAINLQIPFAPQAPNADWSMPYKEACEEATLIMIDHYFKKTPLDHATMKEEILKMVAWEDKTFGYSIHTNAGDIARIAREYMGYGDVEIQYDFSVDDLKAAVARGEGIVLLAAGRLLNNPNFKTPGPLYHALVVKGYMKNYFITNDPGTRNGEDYLYTPEVLMKAAHDWDPKDMLQTPSVLVLLGARDSLKSPVKQKPQQ